MASVGPSANSSLRPPKWEPTVEVVVLGVTLGDMLPLCKASTIFPLLMLLQATPQPQDLSGLLVNQISKGSTQHGAWCREDLKGTSSHCYTQNPASVASELVTWLRARANRTRPPPPGRAEETRGRQGGAAGVCRRGNRWSSQERERALFVMGGFLHK